MGLQEEGQRNESSVGLSVSHSVRPGTKGQRDDKRRHRDTQRQRLARQFSHLFISFFCFLPSSSLSFPFVSFIPSSLHLPSPITLHSLDTPTHAHTRSLSFISPFPLFSFPRQITSHSTTNKKKRIRSANVLRRRDLIPHCHNHLRHRRRCRFNVSTAVILQPLPCLEACPPSHRC